ncbi:ABC transporter substrate-binding protein/permease [Secundilactobacillus malefermentans]|uniref:ABC transmembrane type-1 domain-containing protein n=1 Tax=Secundilactobacillus malefermentans TaxID=176292 RepID=A0A4R5NLI3_9LACO|nr:ABC transporter substrate-binding protein/permease [Secundilactobacillus malefermentans]KRM60034.1 polar amino acid ABC transporter inner membrane subunit [Secundilactobacillus malefermentans DSM 5705 = KCTC 3548]QEA30809.1 ABC transporter substrate-binding protein/permease [Secundilactobacillus malefermentans]TDG75164.1 hypothetical protein C5L31_001041 [Secundilactobacillus malefermentans]
MKELKQLLIMMAMVIVGITAMSMAPSSVHAATDNSLAAVQKKGTLVLATSPDYPPYEFQVNQKGKSKIVGMDVSIAKKIAKDIHVKLVIKSMTFDSLLVALETGKADMVLGGMNPTPSRRQSVDFSDIYYMGGQDFLINKADASKYPNQKSLANQKIGAQTGTLQYNLAKKYIPGVTIKGMDKGTDLVLALKTHKLEAVGMEKPTAEAYAKNDSSVIAIHSSYKLDKNSTGSAIAFRKGSDSLVAAANKSIREIKKDDLINKVYLNQAGKYLKVNTANTSMGHYWKYFAEGVEYTLIIAAVSGIIGVLLGVILALMRLANNKLLKGIAVGYIEFVRGTPLMVQVLFVYFGVGVIINLPALVSGIIAVSLNSGAYIAEIIRGGIDSVSKGQDEAAKSLGLSKTDIMRSVILPQALKNIWPALGNEFISLIKESSIVSIIGVTDLIYQLNIVRADTYRGVMPVFVAMVLYFILTFGLTRILNHFEGRMQHDS